MKNKPITHVQLPSIEVIENLHFNIRVRDTRIKDLEKELKALKQSNLTNSLGNGIFGQRILSSLNSITSIQISELNRRLNYLLKEKELEDERGSIK